MLWRDASSGRFLVSFLLERLGGDWFMGLVVVFEHAILALKLAIGRSQVTQHEVVPFDFFGCPSERRGAFKGSEKVVVIAVCAQATKFGLGDF